MSNFKKILLAMVVLTATTAAAFRYSGIKHDLTTTVSSGGTVTLTSASSQVRQITGVLTHTVVLPAANTLSTGYWYIVSNDSTGTVAVQDAGLNGLYSVTADQSAVFYVVDASTANGVWDVQKGASAVGGGGGTLTQSTKTANYTLTNADDVIYCNSGTSQITISLHSAATAGSKAYRVKNINMQSCWITPTGGDLFMGSNTSFELIPGATSLDGPAVTIIPNGGSLWSMF